jgi:hypothetical protein
MKQSRMADLAQLQNSSLKSNRYCYTLSNASAADIYCFPAIKQLPTNLTSFSMFAPLQMKRENHLRSPAADDGGDISEDMSWGFDQTFHHSSSADDDTPDDWSDI